MSNNITTFKQLGDEVAKAVKETVNQVLSTDEKSRNFKAALQKIAVIPESQAAQHDHEFNRLFSFVGSGCVMTAELVYRNLNLSYDKVEVATQHLRNHDLAGPAPTPSVKCFDKLLAFQAFKQAFPEEHTARFGNSNLGLEFWRGQPVVVITTFFGKVAVALNHETGYHQEVLFLPSDKTIPVEPAAELAGDADEFNVPEASKFIEGNSDAVIYTILKSTDFSRFSFVKPAYIGLAQTFLFLRVIECTSRFVTSITNVMNLIFNHDSFDAAPLSEANKTLVDYGMVDIYLHGDPARRVCTDTRQIYRDAGLCHCGKSH